MYRTYPNRPFSVESLLFWEDPLKNCSPSQEGWKALVLHCARSSVVQLWMREKTLTIYNGEFYFHCHLVKKSARQEGGRKVPISGEDAGSRIGGSTKEVRFTKHVLVIHTQPEIKSRILKDNLARLVWYV
jgi:hypothetical protein